MEDYAIQDYFPFHQLPVLVQSKILRQYIPFFCKTFVLSRLPEFSELLTDRYSWLNLSEAIINLSRILQPLQTGIYWNLKQDTNLGYYLSTDAEKISLTLCCINRDPVFDFIPVLFYQCRERMCISVETMHNFITKFLEKYSITNRVYIYEVSKGNHIYINYSKKKVYWTKKVYNIRDNMCILKHSSTRTLIINLKENDSIELIHHIADLNQPFKRRKQEIEPISLDSFILNRNEKIVPHKILEMNFRVVEDHISLNLNLNTNIRSCSIHRRKLTLNRFSHLTDTLSEFNILFRPLQSCRCLMQKLEKKRFR